MTEAARTLAETNEEIAFRMEQSFKVTGDRWFKLAADRLHSPLPGTRVALADHAEIGRMVARQPREVQKAIVTIAAHCVVLKDGPDGILTISDLAGCISQCCFELAAALPPAPMPEREGMREALKSFEGLLQEADWLDEHGGDHHDDNCQVCTDIAKVRAALASHPERESFTAPIVETTGASAIPLPDRRVDKFVSWLATIEGCAKIVDELSNEDHGAGAYSPDFYLALDFASQAIRALASHDDTVAVSRAESNGAT